MNKQIKKLAILPMIIAAAPLMQSCIEEEMPTNYATEEQVNNSDQPAAKMVDGLAAMMVDQFTYNGDQVAYDWGYPCQMVIRDILGGDEPVVGSRTGWDYLSWIADNSNLTYHSLYTYSYYYDLIANANNIIRKYADEEMLGNKAYEGVAMAYRALSYMDLTRMFEYKKTGFSNLDDAAKNVMGLTVPIVTEKTTATESQNNPRVPFYTMYRFIMNDLDTAEKDLEGYDFSSDKTIPSIDVIYGLKARLWLEMATRFEKSSEDLATQVAHEGDADGYAKLGIQSAEECYAKAAHYAESAKGAYTPLTKAEWHDKQTGFNTANHAWLWAASTSTKEMISYEWYTWTCWMAPESASFSWGPCFNCYRAIDAALFDKISDKDWRKTTWIAPKDAGERAVPDGYSTLLSNDEWRNYPAYTALKFRPKYGNTDNYKIGLLTDIPLMRVEEMFFIDAEAKAHTQGVEAGKAILEDFMNDFRYTDGSYTCDADNMNDFIKELMVQKRIEFWGEGLIYFDTKRLALKIQRFYEDSNYPTSAQINSKEGYVAPWLNYYIYDYERDNNQAVILNPDPSNAVVSQTDY